MNVDSIYIQALNPAGIVQAQSVQYIALAPKLAVQLLLAAVLIHIGYTVPDNQVYACHCETQFLYQVIVQLSISNAVHIISQVVYDAQYAAQLPLWYLFAFTYHEYQSAAAQA